jgi:hypothetical protein
MARPTLKTFLLSSELLRNLTKDVYQESTFAGTRLPIRCLAIGVRVKMVQIVKSSALLSFPFELKCKINYRDIR